MDLAVGVMIEADPVVDDEELSAGVGDFRTSSLTRFEIVSGVSSNSCWTLA